MALTITKNWDDGTALTESHLDDIKTSLETFVNTTKLDSNSIQTGGISAANLASGSVTAAKIDSSAVTTAKLASGAVTQAKRAALGQQVSSSSSTFTTAATSATDVTNLSVNITTTGRPVWLGLVPDATSSNSIASVSATGSVSSVGVVFRLVRDATTISNSTLSHTPPASTSTLTIGIPPSAISYVDVPSAATYTYKVQVFCTGSNMSAAMSYMKLVAYEL